MDTSKKSEMEVGSGTAHPPIGVIISGLPLVRLNQAASNPHFRSVLMIPEPLKNYPVTAKKNPRAAGLGMLPMNA
jgi:hypothetical protein